MVGWGWGGIGTTVLDQLDPGMRGRELQSCRGWAVGSGAPGGPRRGCLGSDEVWNVLRMFCAVHCRFLPCSLFLPPHPRHKTMHCSAVGQPTKILCRLSSTFRQPPGPREGLSPGWSLWPGSPGWEARVLPAGVTVVTHMRLAFPVLVVVCAPSRARGLCPLGVGGYLLWAMLPRSAQLAAHLASVSCLLGVAHRDGHSGESLPCPAWLCHGRVVLGLCSLLRDSSWLP